MQDSDTLWKPCSSCKKPINFSAEYYKCSVSTCRRNRTELVFCSVACWDAHLPFARHRDAWAVDATAPSKSDWSTAQDQDNAASAPRTPQRRIVGRASAAPTAQASGRISSDETLVVVSRVKKAIAEGCGMNTSQCAIDALTRIVLREVNHALSKAQEAERKTIMGRDFN